MDVGKSFNIDSRWLLDPSTLRNKGETMPEYKFTVQGFAEVTVEADNAEAARMMLIEDESLYEGKIMGDVYISDGEEVKCAKQ